jgi:hypothetical protein
MYPNARVADSVHQPDPISCNERFEKSSLARDTYSCRIGALRRRWRWAVSVPLVSVHVPPYLQGEEKHAW